MKLKNVTSTLQVLSDGTRFLAVEPGAVVTVSAETAFRLLLRAREWAHAQA